MASFVYNVGAFNFASQACNWDTSSNLKVLLVTSTYTADKDHADVADVTNEVTVSGYARQSLAAASTTITNDTTNDRCVFDGPDVTFSALAAGETVGGAVIFEDLGADADSPLICFVDLTNTASNGGDMTITWSASGIFYSQQ